MSSFTSGLELEGSTTIPYTSWIDTGTTNTLPAPIAIPFTVTNNLSNLNYNVAGSLVTLANVFFGTNAGNTISTTANITVGVTNASGQPFFVLFSAQDLDTAGQTLPAFASSVTGVMYGISTNELFVTRFADIVTTVAPSSIPLSMTVSGATLTFNWSDSLVQLAIRHQCRRALVNHHRCEQRVHDQCRARPAGNVLPPVSSMTVDEMMKNSRAASNGRPFYLAGNYPSKIVTNHATVRIVEKIPA